MINQSNPEQLEGFIDSVVEELNEEIDSDVQGDIDVSIGIREPDDWTVGIIGSKGSLKTLMMVRYIMKSLMCEVSTFSNLNIYPNKWKGSGTEYLDGQSCNDLDIDDLLKFHLSDKLFNSFITIDEVRTWFETMRSNSNTQIVLANWGGQTRKDVLKIMWTAQPQRMPPSHLVAVTDVLVYARDYCFSPWGIEHRLPRGCIGKYVAVDQNGYFTGYPGNMRMHYLHHAERFWNCYETRQQQDPYAFSRKTTFSGNELKLDSFTDERNAELRGLKESSEILQDTAVMNMIMANLDDLGGTIGDGQLVISSSRVKDAISHQSPQYRRALSQSWNAITKLADQGQMVKINGKDMVHIALPEMWEEN